jgi:hypothetical protein
MNDEPRGDGLSHFDDPDGEFAFVCVIICELDVSESQSVMLLASNKYRGFVVWIKASRSSPDLTSRSVA